MGWRRGMDGRLAGSAEKVGERKARSGQAASRGAGGVWGGWPGVDPRDVEPGRPSTTSRSAVAEVTTGSKRTFARFSSRDTETASRGCDRGVTVRMARGTSSRIRARRRRHASRENNEIPPERREAATRTFNHAGRVKASAPRTPPPCMTRTPSRGYENCIRGGRHRVTVGASARAPMLPRANEDTVNFFQVANSLGVEHYTRVVT